MMPPRPNGQHHRADHLGPGRAQSERPLLLARRRQAEHLAGDRGDDGHDHEPDDQAGDEERAVERRGVRLEDRDEGEVAARSTYVVPVICGLEHVQRPKPEDDARDGGTEVDHRDEGPAGAEPGRTRSGRAPCRWRRARPTMTAMTEMTMVPYIWARAPKWYGLWSGAVARGREVLGPHRPAVPGDLVGGGRTR